MKIRNSFATPVWLIWLVCLVTQQASARTVHHYVYFVLDRERIAEASFLETKAFEGAQLMYTWRELEPEKDRYDFSTIRKDLAFLTSKGKKLFIQLQDVTFSAKWKFVPAYLQTEEFRGGVAPQYERSRTTMKSKLELQAGSPGAREPAVQERYHKLLNALGKEFDGKIAGINLPETSIDFGETGRLRPSGFTPEIYRDAVVNNMKALKRAFPKSIVIQYANFMPGEWLPGEDKGYLRTVYREARALGVGVGGPDLLQFRRGQNNHSYPLIKASAGLVPTGVAVQDGNYSPDPDPKTGKRATIAEILAFATDQLKLDIVFWCTEEPYYSKELIPFMRQGK